MKSTDRSKGDPPNVLFIAIDDLNDWIGVLKGHPNANTPNIDRLAARGIAFSNAQSQVPLCGPSRASIMTGLRPSTTGIYGQIEDNDIRRDNPATENIKFLPEYFRENGYHTMGIGKLFHKHAPAGVFDESGGREHGFGPLPAKKIAWKYGVDKNGPEYGNTITDWGAFPATDSLMPDYRSASWVADRLLKEYQKPFFMAVGFVRPHVPFYVPQKWFDMYPIDSIALPAYLPNDMDDIPEIGRKINDLPMMPSTEWAIKNKEWKKIVQAYLACISFVDHQVGKILDALERSPHAKNTIIVLWSDHGYRLGEKATFAKHCLWNEATNAPLIFAGPGIDKGKMVNQSVELLSIYPTLLGLTGLPAYDRNEGIDMSGLLMGKIKTDSKLVAITTYGAHNHAIRSEAYTYIRYEDGGEELYDRKKDPNEWHNLAGQEIYREVKESMKQHLPTKNVNWALHSAYNYNPYGKEQKQKYGGD